jgi:hypothetical protein
MIYRSSWHWPPIGKMHKSSQPGSLAGMMPGSYRQGPPVSLIYIKQDLSRANYLFKSTKFFFSPPNLVLLPPTSIYWSIIKMSIKNVFGLKKFLIELKKKFQRKNSFVKFPTQIRVNRSELFYGKNSRYIPRYFQIKFPYQI